MPWGGAGVESGRGVRAMGREHDANWDRDTGRDGYKRWGGGLVDRSNGRAKENLAPRNSHNSYGGSSTEQTPPAASTAGAIAGLEKRLSSTQHQFMQELHNISEKQNEKFDLIFSILSELQGRQAQLEETVRSFAPAQMMQQQQIQQPQQPQQHQQPEHQGHFAGSGGSGGSSQTYGQMNGSMAGQISMPQQIQQFSGVMNPDGTQAMYSAVPQMVVVASPQAPGMPFQMPQQMAMQFIGPCHQTAGGFAMASPGPGTQPMVSSSTSDFSGATDVVARPETPASGEQAES